MTPAEEPCYFTCTLGQATEINKDRAAPFQNINEFIDQQADAVPNLPAVGFAEFKENDTGDSRSHCFSFQDVHRGTSFSAQVLDRLLQQNRGSKAQKTVALLSPSCPEFLFAWLGLIRLGYGVLLLAPQCQPSAVAHLCNECHVETLFVERTYADLAGRSAESFAEVHKRQLACLDLGFETTSADFLKALREPVGSRFDVPASDQSSVAYLHHTSGTSTGLPKSIPQSHRAAICVLPRFKDASDHATFTTTPLYHGGVADLFRAWTSNAMIWLFPGRGVPITAKNILKCLDQAATCNEQSNTPRVTYFASVPYVLQMLASDAKGLQALQSMDIAGVGGAALPPEVGDDLVTKGVNLISRFGSAECGFLMSSHRSYAADNEWQYLRATHGSNAIAFESRDDGLSELVVLPNWPHRVDIYSVDSSFPTTDACQAKTNRPDGSYTTSDLFLPHPSIPNAWKYHSRADSQLTLITGKKFDPAPFEAAIATSALLDDVLIFGNGRPFPGALLLRSAAGADASDDELVAALAPAIEKLNSESQDHARLARSLLVPIAHGENRLEKSSKGTVLRNRAEETYSDVIDAAYANLYGAVKRDVADAEVPPTIARTVASIVGKGEVNPETDLFAYGVDSVASIQIRYTLNQLLPERADDLPLNVVEDCGTVARLSDFILAARRGETMEADEDELQVMRDLADQYGDFTTSPAIPSAPETSHSDAQDPSANVGAVVLLTGATGALGAHILDLLRADPGTHKIYCLARGASSHAAHERVSKSLEARGLARLASAADDGDAKVTVIQARLSDARLGLGAATHAALAAQVTTVLHVAWAVNFRMRLRSFVADHIAGCRHLLDLAHLAAQRHHRRIAFAFCSSVASVSALASASTVSESRSHEPADASTLGYARSKWVAEDVCARAHEQLRDAGVRVGVFRVGQLAGDTARGVWNASEAWPTLLGSARATGCLPRLHGEPLAWLPVDVAAAAMVQGAAALLAGEHAVSTASGTVGDGTSVVPVYHVVNDAAPAPSWADALAWLTRLDVPFDAVEPRIWLARLEALQRSRPSHPALRLLGVWRAAYGDGGAGDSSEAAAAPAADSLTSNDTNNGSNDATPTPFVTQRSRATMPALRGVRAVDEAYFGRLWRWIAANVGDGGEGGNDDDEEAPRGTRACGERSAAARARKGDAEEKQ